MKADYVPGNLSRQAFSELGTLYRRTDDQGRWDDKAPWRSAYDEYQGQQPARDIVFVDAAWHSLRGYEPGRNATAFSPQGGLRTSLSELTHPLELLMNDGVYQGRRILQPSSVTDMLRPHWVYDPAAPNGDTYEGAFLAYGLGAYQIDGNSSARVCRHYDIDLVGHTGEAYGLLSGLFFRPGTKDGFVYVLNGLGVEPDHDPRSAGQFSGNYIWEEKIMEAISHALWEKEFSR